MASDGIDNWNYFDFTKISQNWQNFVGKAHFSLNK
jgi:hypothetical protein